MALFAFCNTVESCMLLFHVSGEFWLVKGGVWSVEPLSMTVFLSKPTVFLMDDVNPVGVTLHTTQTPSSTLLLASQQGCFCTVPERSVLPWVCGGNGTEALRLNACVDLLQMS